MNEIYDSNDNAADIPFITCYHERDPQGEYQIIVPVSVAHEVPNVFICGWWDSPGFLVTSCANHSKPTMCDLTSPTFTISIINVSRYSQSPTQSIKSLAFK